MSSDGPRHGTEESTMDKTACGRLPEWDHDLEAGQGTTERQSADSSDAATLAPESYDIAKVPTANDEPNFPATNERTVPTEGTSGFSTPSSDPSTRYARPSFDGHHNLIRTKTQVKKKWTSNPRKGIKTTTKYFYQEIDESWTVALVITCFFAAGVIDAVAYECWGTFLSMQTGNTILVALRIADVGVRNHPLSYVKNLTSIGCYCLGSLIFNIVHRVPTGVSVAKAPLHRWTLFAAFCIQVALISVSAILATLQIVSTTADQSGTNSSGLENYRDLIPIALLAFEASGQVCISRVLVVSDLPTIVISTLYHDFFAELLTARRVWKSSKTKWEFIQSQKKQWRRLFSITALFGGALVGGFMFTHSPGLRGALWVAAGTKMCICLAWCLWPKKTVTETVVTTEKKKQEQQRQQQELEQSKKSEASPQGGEEKTKPIEPHFTRGSFMQVKQEVSREPERVRFQEEKK